MKGQKSEQNTSLQPGNSVNRGSLIVAKAGSI